MGDPAGLEPDLDQDPLVKAMLRFTSFAFPSIVTILALLLCWRAHFSKNSLIASIFILACGIYFAIYCYRRSRGLSANLGYNNPGPDRDWSYNDQSDIAALWGAVIFVGFIAYMVIKDW
jgi:drug/metabolite transporter (DMT)-like permease